MAAEDGAGSTAVLKIPYTRVLNYTARKRDVPWKATAPSHAESSCRRRVRSGKSVGGSAASMTGRGSVAPPWWIILSAWTRVRCLFGQQV